MQWSNSPIGKLQEIARSFIGPYIGTNLVQERQLWSGEERLEAVEGGPNLLVTNIELEVQFPDIPACIPKGLLLPFIMAQKCRPRKISFSSFSKPLMPSSTH